jgi:integrase/recombinase XerD
MFDPASVRFMGPLTPYVGGFWSELLRQGYAPLSARNLLYVAAHFSRWLKQRSLGVEDITDEVVAAFMRHRRRRGYTGLRTPRALRPLVEHLRGIGVVPAARPAVALGPVDQLVQHYAEFLVRERGLAPSTIRHHVDFARRFATDHLVEGRLEWATVTAAEITRFVLAEARRRSIGYCKLEVTVLRSLLRYLHATGRVADLVGCVPAVAGWRLAWLPKGLEPDQLRALLRCCDHRSAIGRRDAAIVLLLVRLGLRAGDVAALLLDDLDWRAGEVVLRGKGRHESRLPLPRDVGRALAAYLRHGRRRRTSSRHVFLRCQAPYTQLTTGGVLHATTDVLRRAGVSVGGAHLLRHTAATQMLRHGASLAEIGHVLRHRHLDTTAIYAKVDFAALRTLVQPWPGGAA